MVKANHALSNSAQGVCGVVMVACTKRDGREVLETRSKANQMRKVSGGGNGGKRRRETVYSLSLSPAPARFSYQCSRFARDYLEAWNRQLSC